MPENILSKACITSKTTVFAMLFGILGPFRQKQAATAAKNEEYPFKFIPNV
jgi:hypothetical protein